MSLSSGEIKLTYKLSTLQGTCLRARDTYPATPLSRGSTPRWLGRIISYDFFSFFFGGGGVYSWFRLSRATYTLRTSIHDYLFVHVPLRTVVQTAATVGRAQRERLSFENENVAVTTVLGCVGIYTYAVCTVHTHTHTHSAASTFFFFFFSIHSFPRRFVITRRCPGDCKPPRSSSFCLRTHRTPTSPQPPSRAYSNNNTLNNNNNNVRPRRLSARQ